MQVEATKDAVYNMVILKIFRQYQSKTCAGENGKRRVYGVGIMEMSLEELFVIDKKITNVRCTIRTAGTLLKRKVPMLHQFDGCSARVMMGEAGNI